MSVGRVNFSSFNLDVITYEAEQISTLQIEMAQLGAIEALIFENKARLASEFSKEDPSHAKASRPHEKEEEVGEAEEMKMTR